MERKLDGRFLLEGVTTGYPYSYYSFDEVDVYPSYEEMANETVSECKLSYIIKEWYEQVYKPGNSSIKFARNP